MVDGKDPAFLYIEQVSFSRSLHQAVEAAIELCMGAVVAVNEKFRQLLFFRNNSFLT